jgi:hypothetical protein
MLNADARIILVWTLTGWAVSDHLEMWSRFGRISTGVSQAIEMV